MKYGPTRSATLLQIARKAIGGPMESSARLCLADAVNLHDSGDYGASEKRSMDSIRYSTGEGSAEWSEAFAVLFK